MIDRSVWMVLWKRLADAAIVVWLVGTLSFVLLHLAPGDPVSAALSDARVSPAIREHWRAVYALDQPLAAQYRRYLVALSRGEFGYSFSQFRPVADALRETLPYSLLLMGLALSGGILAGAVVGTWQAVRRRSRSARVSLIVMSAITAIPDVWLALLLLAGLGAQLSLFPLSGRCDPVWCDVDSGWRAIADTLAHAALPALTLALIVSAAISRVQRTALRDVLHDDVMRLAMAKGVPSHRRLMQHAVRRAARPLVATVGLSLPMLVGGSVFVERVFGWPGMGTLLIGAIGVRDYPLVTAVSIVGCVLVLAGGMCTDAVSAVLDRRWSTDR